MNVPVNTSPTKPSHNSPTQHTFTPNTHSEELLVCQQAFRAVMDAMARPGLARTLVPMPRPTLANAWLETLTQMLIDNSCTFCVAAGDEHALAEALSLRSYAVQAPSEEAHFAVITADASEERCSETLSALSGGTDASPERGATALIECTTLEAYGATTPTEIAAGTTCFAVSGPGVASRHFFCVTNPWWHEIRERRNDEFPCGIDLILIDATGCLVALPRTARLESYLPQNLLQQEKGRD